MGGTAIQSINDAGKLGFGVGIAPQAALVSIGNLTPMNGYDDPSSDNYGNYQGSDGSIMCFIPAFCYRSGYDTAPTKERDRLNALEITYDTSMEGQDGWILHRAFWNAGKRISGFFIDKYMASKNADSTSCVSVKNGDPLALTLYSNDSSNNGTSQLPDCKGYIYDAIVLGYEKRIYETFFAANIANDYKPNVIFDTTFATLEKAKSISKWLDFGGYALYNRHLIWVLNDIEIAIKQNKTRARSVSYEILLNTHTNSALTIKQLMQENNRNYFDGDVYIVFNRLKDTLVDKHEVKELYQSSNEKKTYTYELKKYTAFQLKQAGKDWMSIDQIEIQILDKINQYTPDTVYW